MKNNISFFNRIINDSGGLVYHYRAFKYRNTLWAAFIENIKFYVKINIIPKNPIGKRLILIGPSAGWTIPDIIFTPFSNIIINEPDTIGAYILKKKILKINPSAILEYDDNNYFQTSDSIEKLFRKYENDIIFFCNILGQLFLIISEDQIVNIMKALAVLFQNKDFHYISYQDRFSGNIKPQINNQHLIKRLSDSQCLQIFYQDNDHSELQNHEVMDLFPSDINSTFPLLEYKLAKTAKNKGNMK